jgi:hypothetical protein
MESRKRKPASELKERNTGIAQKVEVTTDMMDVITTQLEEKREEIETIDTDAKNITKDILSCRYEQTNQLYNQTSRLYDELSRLQDENCELQIAFLSGEYYAFTDSYWKIGEVTRKGNEWSTFVRQFGENERFQSRFVAEQSTSNSTTTDPYVITRTGAVEKKWAVPNSDSTSIDSIPPKDVTYRYVTNVFGRKAWLGEIAYLVPASTTEAHKQWLNVACAVLGIESSVDIDIKQKAARGYIQEDDNENARNISNPSRNISNLSLNDSANKKDSTWKEGTGVTHFEANKIWLKGQKSALDGQEPYCLLVPVMTLEAAKNWRGNGYNTVCLVGMPKGSPVKSENSHDMFRDIGLADPDLIRVEHTRDAKQEEVKVACTFLETAVVALHDMIASLSEEELDYVTTPHETTNPLRQAHDEAKCMKCKVPRPLATSELGGKPVCLLTFGDHDDTSMHPAPDPLLLVLRAANTFGIMAGMKMLAGTENDDYDDDFW